MLNCGLPSKSIVLLPKRTKLGPKTIDCVFIDFHSTNVAYRFLVYKSEIFDIYVNNIIEFINAKFFIAIIIKI